MFRLRIFLSLLSVAAWLSPAIATAATATATTKIHMVVVADSNFRSKYEPLFERMESYANHQGYFWHLIGSSNDGANGANESCQDKFKFFFRKHCIVANWTARKTDPGDRVFVFDADVVPFRHQIPLYHWAEMPEDLIFYDRTWNNEIMAGNYMIRNVPPALAFLKQWAEYEYQRPPGFSSADNGAIHLHMINTIFGTSADNTVKLDLDICSSKYHHLTESVENLDPYYSFVGCTRELVPAGSYLATDLSVRIMKKNTAWTMDGVFDNYQRKVRQTHFSQFFITE